MIEDSGERKEFKTGAVRDITKGKGRCDLLPLDVVSDYLTFLDGKKPYTILAICGFVNSRNENCLLEAMYLFMKELNLDRETAMLEVAIHFEEGATKYGERNWEAGIDIHCYIDSAVRHYLKWRRGDIDERHDRAVLWNLMCCRWTLRHKPEMMDIKEVQVDE